MTVYEKYCQLNIDGRWINLEKTDNNIKYFCTPIGADIIGWENGGIHYCFIDGYGEMVFAANPETCADSYVYPLAKNFEDFLRLILVCGSTTAVEQIILWNKEQFDNFLHSENNPIVPEQRTVLDRIQAEFNLTPMANSFEYVKDVQTQFDDSKIKYSNEYYEILGLDYPDVLLTPFGKINILVDDVAIQYEARTFDYFKPPVKDKPIEGCYRIHIPVENSSCIQCMLDLEDTQVDISGSSGERYLCREFQKGTTMLAIGIEDENSSFDSERVENGMQYRINDRIDEVIIGIAWATDYEGADDVRVWFAADPTVSFKTESEK